MTDPASDAIPLPPSDAQPPKAPPSFASQALYQTLGRTAAALLQAVVFALLARDVRPSVFGWVAVVNGITTFASVFFDLGLVTYIAKYRTVHDNARVRTAVRLNSLSTLLLGVACAVPIEFAYHTDLPFLVPAMIGISNTLDKNVETLCAIPVADGQTRYSAESILLRRASWLALFLIFGPLVSSPAEAFSLAWLISEVLGQFHARPVARRALISASSDYPWRQTIREGFPFLITNVSAQGRLLDSTLVSLVSTATQAGLYSAATKIVAPFLLIPGTLASLVLPNAARRTPAEGKRIGWYLVASTVVLAGILAVLGPVERWGVVLVFGAKYRSSASILYVALLGAPFIALSTPLCALLQARDREHFVAMSGLAFGVLVVGALAVGATVGGGVGAAAGLGVAFALQCSLLFVALLRLT